jgi:hypothetical protein
MLLGLDESWEVADVNLELEAKRVTIRLDFNGRRVVCPGCGGSCSKADHAPERTLRRPQKILVQRRSVSAPIFLFRFN